MKIGYIRVSKQEQNEALQRDALKEAGCEKYFSDKMTGSTFERKGLEDTLAFIRLGGHPGVLQARRHPGGLET
jgi:DNA invertase Pin-like site-specific DNA recombinase